MSANVSLLFPERPYLERFGAAAEAGFTRVETWWPFPYAEPGHSEIDDLLMEIERSGLTLTGLNFFAGDMPGGERGIACLPDRADELLASIPALQRIAEATGCQGFNLLYGQIPDDSDPHVYHQHALRMIEMAASAVASHDGTVLLEPLAQGLNGGYPLHTAEDVVAILDTLPSDNTALLLDTFHLGYNGVDVPSAIDTHAQRIGHVQLADTPDRGEPGSGSLDWRAIASSLERVGYTGTVAAEYKPTTDTHATLGWLKH